MRVAFAVLLAACCMLQAETIQVEVDCLAALDPGVRRTVMGQVLDVEGMVPSAEPGAPLLPVMPVQVLLPPGMMAVSVSVVEARPEVVEQYGDPKPAQHGVPLSRPEDFVPTELSEAAVRSAAELPLASLAGQGTLMGYPVADVLIRPFRWDPEREVLTAAVSSMMELELAPGGRVPPVRGVEGSRAARDVVAFSVSNALALAAYPTPPVRYASPPISPKLPTPCWSPPGPGTTRP